MDNPRSVFSPSVHVHRRQFAWQILVPLLVAAALIIAAAVLISIGTASATRTWADISTIWLIVPMLFVALILVIVLVLLIYGIAKLLQVAPYYTGKAQDFLVLLNRRTRKIADGSAKPFFWVHQAGAVLKSIFRL